MSRRFTWTSSETEINLTTKLIGQKEAEAEKQEMPTRDEARDANLGQKKAEREKADLTDEDEECMAEDDEE